MLNRIKIIGCLMCMILGMLLSGCNEQDEDTLELQQVELEEQEEDTETEEEDEATELFVHVCGQVANPGVYRLSMGSRVFEAVEMAGGLTDTADPSSINQAEALLDGQQVYIPAEGEAITGQESLAGNGTNAGSGLVNINTAAKEELMTLSGIGEVRALSIINHRETHGKFQSVEELKEVEGIKDGIFQKIKDKIQV